MALTIVASHSHTPGDVEGAIEFLKRTRNELRMLRKVRVWKEKFHVYDINNHAFEITGVGYPDPDIIPILNQVNAVFNPQTIHDPTDDEFKEIKTGKRRPWAEDRVM